MGRVTNPDFSTPIPTKSHSQSSSLPVRSLEEKYIYNKKVKVMEYVWNGSNISLIFKRISHLPNTPFVALLAFMAWHGLPLL